MYDTCKLSFFCNLKETTTKGENMLTKGQKGLIIGLMMAIIISSIASFNYVTADTDSITSVFVGEEEWVSLRTIPIATGSAVTVTGTAVDINPKPITIVKGEEDEADTSIIVIEMKTLKSVSLSLKEVRKKFHKKMNLCKPSGLSKKKFKRLIRNMKCDYKGFFKKNAELIWILAHKYHFNEVFFVGVIANESWWGSDKSAIANNNYTGQKMHGKLICYASVRECLEKTAKNIGQNYLKKKGKYYAGQTLYDVNMNYCEAGVHEDGTSYKFQWADEVYGCMETFLGQ